MPVEFSSEQRSIIALNLVPLLEYGQFQNLLEHFGSAQQVMSADEKELSRVPGISRRIAQEITGLKHTEDTEKEIEKSEKLGVRIFTCIDPDYPGCLKNLPDYPPVLYIKGTMMANDFLSVAIVGTRKPTPYGLSAASSFTREFARAGITCVSGLARGIDSEIHRGCVREKARTIAVLGNGLARHYPPENRKLEEDIVKDGALVSEFPLQSPPDKAHFPRRNRLIASLALATVVIEANLRSGSLITARCAIEQGKDVFAVPGSISSDNSRGTHYLIKTGAHLAESAQDVIVQCESYLNLQKEKKKSEKQSTDEIFSCGSPEREILSALEHETNGISIDQLTQKIGISLQDAAASLLTLELKGLVRSLPGKMYIRLM